MHKEMYELDRHTNANMVQTIFSPYDDQIDIQVTTSGSETMPLLSF